MKKNLTIILLTCCIAVSLFSFSACGIGSATITLDYGIGSGSVSELYYTNGDTVSSLPYPNAPIYFKFDTWCYDEELTRTVSLPFTAGNLTLYARYEINEDFNFPQTYYVGATTLANYTFNSEGNYKFLLKDQTGLQALTSIEVTASDGSNFVCEKITLLEKYGRALANNTWFSNQWTPKTTMDNTGIYIISIDVQTAGDAQISFKYENTY